ncbi:MAG: hypothetical protein KGJ99_02180 [Betaproteobacteria bacterium]|nr:hypothetical protein [Betaproteobacteria bacterium]
MRTALAVLVSAALAGVPAAHATETDDAALRQDVKALKEMVRDLQHRVSVLEARSTVAPKAAQVAPNAASAAAQATPAGVQPAPAVPPAPPIAAAAPAAPIAALQPGASAGYASPEAALRANWSKIKEDLDAAAVTHLLGAPSKKFTLDGRTVWYYYYPGIGGGSIFFTDAGRVSSRQSPFGWGW